jgi:hypothetical protein
LGGSGFLVRRGPERRSAITAGYAGASAREAQRARTGAVLVSRGYRNLGGVVGSVIKKRRKRMAKKKHRKLLRKTRVQRRNKK